MLVELAGCWAIVLIITGLYLWWPKSGNGLAGIFYPRIHQGKRIFWRDLHATIGIWISFFTLFLLISGLPWALVWGSAFKELRQFSFEHNLTFERNLDSSEIATLQHDHNAMENFSASTPDWSTGRSDETQELIDSERKNKQIPTLSSTVMASAQALKFSSPAEISLSRKDDNVWKLTSHHQNRMLRSTAWIDGNTGIVMEIQNFSDKKFLDKAIGIGVAAHEGQLFGWMNQLLGLITTLGLIIMSISGFILWRSRKPEHELGAPKKLPDTKVGNGVIAITLLLAIFLPLLAISIIALIFFEYVLLKRIPKIENWLGLQKI